MTILLYTLGILISFLGKLYVMKHKKKLSNENLVEFEKNIKPKIIKLILLSSIPLLTICIYLISIPKEIKIRFFILWGIALIMLTIFGYMKSKKIINQSPNAEHYKYALNYFIFMCAGQILILSAAVNSLKEYCVF